ncbi:DegT/DnrJ/EryC1/StrS family aminotransferase [Sulfitobacter pacificus]|uniref:DegT/DnrJ/EryC1/StrS family aminotransferase n=1 Tax=Sulfitobacter pacificus TaxID=1499314 RepID=UPI003103050C
MLNGPFAPWPSFTQEEADAVSRVLLSNKVNYWTGTESREFEREFADFAGTTHAIALANGTLALDLALHGLGIGAQNGGRDTDEVIVTPRSFIASASAIVNAGARPVFADVDADSQNISPDTVKPCITDNTRAVLCVHLAGWPCDMDGIRTCLGDRDIKLIEDCAQAHGARYKGRPVGGLGDVGAWSFCQDKIMTTGGEGGMVTCNDKALWKKMWAFKDHGKSWDAVYQRDHPPGFRWLHEGFGTNWRITEMQSVIGRIQLARMPDWQAARGKNAAALSIALQPFCHANGPVRLPMPEGVGGVESDTKRNTEPDYVHAWYKFYAFVQPFGLASGWTRDRIVTQINNLGVPCMQGSCSEMYVEKAFDGTTFRPATPLPVARGLGETSLMFLVHPSLTAEDIAKTCDAVTQVLTKASKTS